jgi:hypothetical protein
VGGQDTGIEWWRRSSPADSQYRVHVLGIDLGRQTGGRGRAGNVDGGMDMVVEQVGSQDREIGHEASGSMCKTENRAVWA